jgi:two-component system osmolarity sensor histidine kinase EnvZ
MTALPADAAGPARPRPWFKRFLPRTLFGRTLLIIVTPVVLAQSIAAFIFFDRHLDNVTWRFASAVAGEIGMVIEEMRDQPERREDIFMRAQRNTGLAYFFEPDATVPANPEQGGQDIMQRQLDRALRARLPLRFAIGDVPEARAVEVALQLPGGVLRVEAPTTRLFSFTVDLFFAWMVGSTVVLFAVAIAFMRNQIRPIGRLAAAADSFGKGREVPGFKPEGAEEVRQAACAFVGMRDRIHRQIAQRTAMLAGVSHDLRTPLTRMRLQLALMGDDPDIVELKGDVEEMQRMIDGYLAFARGEGGETPVETDLALLVEEVAAAARRAGADVAVETPGSVMLPLRPEAMRRCLANLLTNAARHAGRIWIRILRRPGHVDVTIDDDGPGIPDGQMAEALKPFVRLDASRNPETGGSGLGLTIALDIARAHGGDLLLARAPQGGLRCLVRLPW